MRLETVWQSVRSPPQQNARSARAPYPDCNVRIPVPGASKSAQVRYLQIVQRSKDENPFRWVRYITESSSYVCRI